MLRVAKRAVLPGMSAVHPPLGCSFLQLRCDILRVQVQHRSRRAGTATKVRHRPKPPRCLVGTRAVDVRPCSERHGGRRGRPRLGNCSWGNPKPLHAVGDPGRTRASVFASEPAHHQCQGAAPRVNRHRDGTPPLERSEVSTVREQARLRRAPMPFALPHRRCRSDRGARDRERFSKCRARRGEPVSESDCRGLSAGQLLKVRLPIARLFLRISRAQAGRRQPFAARILDHHRISGEFMHDLGNPTHSTPFHLRLRQTAVDGKTAFKSKVDLPELPSGCAFTGMAIRVSRTMAMPSCCASIRSRSCSLSWTGP